MSETTSEAGEIYEIVAYVFKEGGADSVRKLFADNYNEWPLFREEIIDIGNNLLSHGLKEPADVMYEIATNYPELTTDNPYSPENKNWGWWEQTLERAKRDGQIEWFEKRYRHLKRDRLKLERGLPTGCGSFITEKSWGDGAGA